MKRLHTLSFEIDGQRCVEIPSWLKKEWIQAHCRKAWDEPVGYCPELYHTWMAGRRSEVARFHEEDPQRVGSYLIPEKVMKEERHPKLPSFIRKPNIDQWKSALRSSRRTFEVRSSRAPRFETLHQNVIERSKDLN